MSKYGTEVHINDSEQGTPRPEPFEMNVLNTGRGAAGQTKLRFYNDSPKTVRVIITEEGVLDEKEFPIPSGHQHPVNLKRDCPKGSHSYRVSYGNELPSNEDPKFIVDDDVDG